MKINFAQASFVKSCLFAKDYPTTTVPEIAVIGRSNAGKSSLINHLTQKKDLVYVSSTPGKTQLLNFFNIDDKLCLVDLPGYGFAKVDPSVKKTWGQALTAYLENREQLQLLILILDLRRDLSEEDKQMIRWAERQGKKILFIFSKHDKLSRVEKEKAEKKLLDSLIQLPLISPPSYLCYSIKENQCRIALRNLMISTLETQII